MNELDEYQQLAGRTCTHERGIGLAHRDVDGQKALMWNALGIAGEAGEVADYIKKVCCHGHATHIEKLAEELGDALWYVASMSSVLGYSLSTIAQMNVRKLLKRYPNGFTQADSISRAV